MDKNIKDFHTSPITCNARKPIGTLITTSNLIGKSIWVFAGYGWVLF
jgi:hypothetical protein